MYIAFLPSLCPFSTHLITHNDFSFSISGSTVVNFDREVTAARSVITFLERMTAPVKFVDSLERLNASIEEAQQIRPGNSFLLLGTPPAAMVCTSSSRKRKFCCLQAASFEEIAKERQQWLAFYAGNGSLAMELGLDNGTNFATDALLICLSENKTLRIYKESPEKVCCLTLVVP